MGKRKKRRFTPQQRAEAVKIVRESGKPVAVVARELDLTPSVLATWVKRAQTDEGGGPAGVLTTAEKAEMAELRRDNKRLLREGSL